MLSWRRRQLQVPGPLPSPLPQAQCQRLRPHLGPVLFQFPANFRTATSKGESNIARLRRLAEASLRRARRRICRCFCAEALPACGCGHALANRLSSSPAHTLGPLLQVLPAGERFVFEFRDASWLCEEVYGILRDHDWCLSICHCTGGRHQWQPASLPACWACCLLLAFCDRRREGAALAGAMQPGLPVHALQTRPATASWQRVAGSAA